MLEESLRLVIDTNVALDLLLFRDARVAVHRAALDSGRARWFATSPMREELRQVMARPLLARYSPDCGHILTEFDRQTTMVPADAVVTSTTLRCRDVADQMFADLALHLRPCTLVTHDRDLLALARSAAALGVRITRPAAADDRPPAGAA